MKKVVLMSATVVVALGAGVAAWFVHAVAPLCANEIVQEALSSDERHRAYLFQRDCGATTGFSTQVTITHGSEQLPEEGGNVFVADGPPWGGPWRIAWDDTTTLVVTIDRNAQTFLAEKNVNGISVRYRTR